MAIRINKLLFLFSLIFFSQCMSGQKTPVPNNINFAIIGNTYPESPYKKYSNKVSELIFNLNKENPVFVIHTGNFINAGKENFGLKEYDIDKQLNDFTKTFKSLRPIMYNCIGIKDTFKNYKLHQKYLNKPTYFSFNYGNLHFVILDTNVKSNYNIDEEQVAWLEKDLSYTAPEDNIIIIVNTPVFTPQWSKKIKTVKQARELHRIFMLHPVKAVISGNESIFFNLEKDNIMYINAGTAPLTRKTWNKEKDYYILTFINNSFVITGKKNEK